jgi:hypothetical protein
MAGNDGIDSALDRAKTPIWNIVTVSLQSRLPTEPCESDRALPAVGLTSLLSSALPGTLAAEQGRTES